MFEDIDSLEKLHKVYGGQRYSGIITPANSQNIFLIHSFRNKKSKDNLDVKNDGGSEIYFAYCGKQQSFGINKAIETHKERYNRGGKYSPIYLFDLQNTGLVYRGEYEYIDTIKKDDSRYFHLRRKPVDYDREKVYFIEEVLGDGSFIKSELGSFAGYFRNEVEEIEILRDERPNALIQEGAYVDENNEIIAVDSDSDKAAKVKQHEYYVSNINRYLVKKHEASEAKPILDEEKREAALFCINTGCGKASFLVLKNEKATSIWGFDCGVETISSFSQKNIYRNNIRRCKEYISSNYLDGNDFVLDRLFISHPHYDHISEITSDVLSENTEVWTNIHIGKMSKNYVGVMNMIKAKGCSIIEPTKKKSTTEIVVLHPDDIIGYSSSDSSIKYNATKLNNVSPIIQININDKSILFTGDIESDGWDWYVSTGAVKLDENLYCHSHHGSETGFYYNSKANNIYDLFNPTDMQMIFTRDGAYSGIVSADIAAKCPAGSGKVYRTDDTDVEIYKVDILKMMISTIR